MSSIKLSVRRISAPDFIVVGKVGNPLHNQRGLIGSLVAPGYRLHLAIGSRMRKGMLENAQAAVCAKTTIRIPRLSHDPRRLETLLSKFERGIRLPCVLTDIVSSNNSSG